MDGWMHGCMDRWMGDGWMMHDGCVDEWMDGWMHGWIIQFLVELEKLTGMPSIATLSRLWVLLITET